MIKHCCRPVDIAYEVGIGETTVVDYKLVFILIKQYANLKSTYTQV